MFLLATKTISVLVPRAHSARERGRVASEDYLGGQLIPGYRVPRRLVTYTLLGFDYGAIYSLSFFH